MPTTPFIRSQFYASPAVLAELERQDIEKLGNIVKNAVLSISSKTELSEDEIMAVLGKVRVRMVGHLQHALHDLEASGDMLHTDAKKLGAAIESAIEMIAEATNLNTDEITHVFTMGKWPNIDSMVELLRARSRADRADQV